MEREPESSDDVFESLLIAYDEALASGEDHLPDESQVPAPLRPRLRATLACLSLLAKARQTDLTLTCPPAAALPDAAPDAAAPDAATATTPLGNIGRFRLLRELGRGGHGVVFLAIDARLSRLLALKVPRPEALVTPELHRRFLREARAASALEHPNLVPIYEAGSDGPLCYIAAAFCEGPTLAAWLKQQSSDLPFRETAELVAALADAVGHAHQHQILHRDIKPANVLLAPAGSTRSPGAVILSGQSLVPRLTDFGLAKLLGDEPSDPTRTGTMLGTPAYMSPEQADGRNDQVGPATDVYALGCMLYELLVGRPPFRGGNDLETIRLVSRAEGLVPPSHLRPGMPRDLEAICLRALAPLPRDRYATAAELADDLRRFLAGRPTAARPVGAVGHARRWLRRRPLWAALVCVTLAALLTIGSGGWWYSARLADALDVARTARQRSDDLRCAADLRSAWQAYRSDHIGEAKRILAGLHDEPNPVEHGFAAQLLAELVENAPPITLLGHRGDVYHVAFSPDGRRVASASQDHTVRLWNAETGTEEALLAGHGDEVNSVTWSPDGKFIASASDDGTVRIWDVASQQELRSIVPSGASEPVPTNESGQPNRDTLELPARVPIVSLVFTPDGAHLVSGDDRGRIVFTRTTDWQTDKIIEAGPGRVDGLAVSRSGDFLATASEERGVQVFDLKAGALPVAWSSSMGNRARCVAFGPGDRLLCGGYTWAHHWDWRAD